MSVDMTVAPEVNAEGIPPSEEPPKQENPQNAAGITRVCSKCKAVVENVNSRAQQVNASKFLCSKCLKAKKQHRGLSFHEVEACAHRARFSSSKVNELMGALRRTLTESQMNALTAFIRGYK